MIRIPNNNPTAGPPTSEHRVRRSGMTLLELVMAFFVASLLVSGIASATALALRSTDSSNLASTHTLRSARRLSEMLAELQFALSVTEQTATAITVTVPDRDDPDTNPETIRYAWSGAPGDPVTRTYNGGAAATFVEDVHDFDIQYQPTSSPIEYLNLTLQITGDATTAVQTSIPLLNRP